MRSWARWRGLGGGCILAGMDIVTRNSSPMMPAGMTDIRVYSFDRAAWIAQEYAEGDCSLRALVAAHPDVIPPVFWLYRWRRDYPEFDLLMRDAERARAQVLADDVLTVADDERATAAERRVRMQARTWTAEKLDRDRYGKASTVHSVHSGSVAVDVPALTDDQLAVIAASGRPALEGVAARIESDPPGPPAVAKAPPGGVIPSDSRDRSPISPESSVDSNDMEPPFDPFYRGE